MFEDSTDFFVDVVVEEEEDSEFVKKNLCFEDLKEKKVKIKNSTFPLRYY